MDVRPATIGDLAGLTDVEAQAFGAHGYPASFFRQAHDLWGRYLLVADADRESAHADASAPPHAHAHTHTHAPARAPAPPHAHASRASQAPARASREGAADASVPRLAGYVLGAPALAPGDAWILSLGVTPHARGRGLGAALVRALLAAFARDAVRTVRLTVAPDNTAARALYDHLGFDVEAFDADAFGPGEARLRMLLRTPS